MDKLNLGTADEIRKAYYQQYRKKKIFRKRKTRILFYIYVFVVIIYHIYLYLNEIVYLLGFGL